MSGWAVVALVVGSLGGGICGTAPVSGGELAKYDTPYYVVHSDLPVEQVREAFARMTTMAEEYHRRTQGFSGEIRSRFPFYLFSNPSDYHAAGGLEGSAGVFIVDGRGQRLMAIARGKSLWRIVQHEGFHQFAHNVIRGRLPVWINEGLAEYFGSAIWTGDGYVCGIIPPDRLKRVKAQIKGNKFLPFTEMLTMSHEEWNSGLSMRNYDQGWSMLHFLVHADDGKYVEALTRHISDLSRGASPIESFAARFGKDIAAFQQRCNEWWAALPDDPCADLYTQSTVATLTSFLARAKTAKVEIESPDDLFAALREERITIDGARYPRLWLPGSLGQDAAKQAAALGEWSLEKSGPRTVLVLTCPNGTTFTGRYTSKGSANPKVEVDVKCPGGGRHQGLGNRQ